MLRAVQLEFQLMLQQILQEHYSGEQYFPFFGT